MSTQKYSSDEFKAASHAAYQGTKRYYEYVQDHVIPVIQNSMSKSEYENSMVGLYYRLHLLARSLVKLDSADTFQAVRSIARSMFELLLDIKTLAINQSLSRMFAAYPMIERTRTAIRVADFVAANPSPERNKKYKHQITLASDPAHIAKCEDILLNVFGITTNIGVDRTRKFPKSWSKRDVRTQASMLGIAEEESYIADYSIDSWFVHGGFAGIENISEDGLVNVYCRGQLLAQKTYHESTFLISQKMHLFDALSSLWADMKQLQTFSNEQFNNIIKNFIR
jgi:hypothetical protein